MKLKIMPRTTASHCLPVAVIAVAVIAAADELRLLA